MGEPGVGRDTTPNRVRIMKSRILSRLFRKIREFHRDERGVESLEWVMSALILAGMIIAFANNLVDPLFDNLFTALDTVNSG